MQCHNIFRIRWLWQAKWKTHTESISILYFIMQQIFLKNCTLEIGILIFFKGTPTLLCAAHDTLTLEEVPLTSTDRKCVMFILKLLVPNFYLVELSPIAALVSEMISVSYNFHSSHLSFRFLFLKFLLFSFLSVKS